MSQVHDNALGQDDATMKKANSCRDLQRYRGSMVVHDTPQYLYHGTVNRFYRDALAASLRSMPRQLNPRSLFRDAGYDSLIVICHSKIPDHTPCGSYRPRPRHIGTAPCTEEVEWSTGLQQVSRIKTAAQTWLTGTLAPLRIPSQILCGMIITGLHQAPHMEQTPGPRLFSQFVSYLPIYFPLSLFHHPSAHKNSGFSLTNTNGQQPGGIDESDQNRGRERASDNITSASSSNPVQSETWSTSKYSEVELDVINSYATPSEGSESRTGTRPTSLSSQYGCALANEEEYVVEELSDREDGEWDNCEVSLNEE